MYRLRNAARIFAFALVLCFALPAALAQKSARPDRADNDAFTREVNRYVLTDANFKKFINVQNNLETLIKNNPSLKTKYENSEVLSNITNFDQGAAKLDSQYPEFAAQIHKAGFSSREYLLFTMSLFQSATTPLFLTGSNRISER